MCIAVHACDTDVVRNSGVGGVQHLRRSSTWAGCVIYLVCAASVTCTTSHASACCKAQVQWQQGLPHWQRCITDASLLHPSAKEGPFMSSPPYACTMKGNCRPDSPCCVETTFVMLHKVTAVGTAACQCSKHKLSALARAFMCCRTIDKAGGLDQYLLHYPKASEESLVAERLREQITAALANTRPQITPASANTPPQSSVQTST